MTTATEEATEVGDTIRIRIEKRATLNYKGAKAQKVYVHVHGGDSYKVQARGCTISEFAANMKAVGIEVTVPKHLVDVPATKLVPVADQKLVPGEEFVWVAKVPEEKDNAAKAAADAKKHAAADGPPLLIIGDEVMDSGEPFVILEFDPTGE